jgi:hypothetical protein
VPIWAEGAVAGVAVQDGSTSKWTAERRGAGGILWASAFPCGRDKNVKSDTSGFDCREQDKGEYQVDLKKTAHNNYYKLDYVQKSLYSPVGILSELYGLDS